MSQLSLNFTDIPIPETCLWEQFDDEQKRIVVETGPAPCQSDPRQKPGAAQ